jgi:23S rRNA (uracil1939-C5)-methyltransferase
MAIIEEGTCRIEKLNAKGLGVATANGKSVEVPYCLPGEVVQFARHSYKNKSNCVLVEVSELSSRRVQPECQYFGKCGGCALQHLPKEDYDSLKRRMIQEPLIRHGLVAPINQTVTVPKGSRRRAVMEAIKKDEQIFLGFHKFHTNQIINIDSCPALLSELSNLIVPLKQTLAKALQHRQKAQIFLTSGHNGIDITLEIYRQPRLSDEQRQLLIAFAKENAIINLLFRAKKFSDVVYSTAAPYVLFDGAEVAIDAHCFLQASHISDQILQELVLAHLPSQAQSAIDLFCGRGTYTLPLSRKLEVTGVESDAKALLALTDAAQKAKLQIKTLRQDLFAAPIATEALALYDFAVINPPRAGASAQIEQLASSKVKTIVYVSCNPETFALDAKILVAGGYSLSSITPLDQFYWSAHLEVVAAFVYTP